MKLRLLTAMEVLELPQTGLTGTSPRCNNSGRFDYSVWLIFAVVMQETSVEFAIYLHFGSWIWEVTPSLVCACSRQRCACDDRHDRFLTDIVCLRACACLYIHGMIASIPNCVGELTSLTSLALHFNDICGAWFHMRVESRKIGFDDTMCLRPGKIPTEIAKLTHLTELHLNNNSIGGGFCTHHRSTCRTIAPSFHA